MVTAIASKATKAINANMPTVVAAKPGASRLLSARVGVTVTIDEARSSSPLEVNRFGGDVVADEFGRVPET